MSSKKFRIPERMLPASALAGLVQVTSPPALRLEGEGDQTKPKESKQMPGLQAWRMEVEVVVGQRTKTLPDGKEVAVLDLRQQAVTIWAESAPTCEIGEYVKLRDLAIGAVDRNFYVWASGLERAS